MLGSYRRGIGAVAATHGGARVLRAVLPRLDAVVMRATSGRRNLSDHAFPTLVLTTTGRRSGQPRPQPLCYVRDGADLVVVGTNWGQEHHPAWTANLLADPRATAAVGGRTVPVVAAEVTGEEWERLYRRFEALGRNYTAYRSWSGDRTPRMFRLRPPAA